MSARRLLGATVLLALGLTGWPVFRPYWPAPPQHGPKTGPDVEAGMLVVDAKDSLTPAQLAALNARHGLQLRFNSIHATEEKLLIGEVDPAAAEAVLAALRRDPDVEAAEPMRRVQLHWTPNDPRFREQWNMRMVGAEKAWDTATGKGIIVAVIDTGVAAETDDRCYQARDFAGTRFVRGYDFVHDDDHPNDDHGHGTHVAGTIAETTNNREGVAGLAFDAAIMPLKVLDSFGSGRSSDIADAIRFAADHGARVINLSLGGPFPDRVTRLACQYAAQKGVLIVCAAGNSSGGPVGYPAAYPECLAVSAVGPSGLLAPYSSVGPQVALAAPGGDKREGEAGGILQNTVTYDPDTGARRDDYFAFQGTSMASPHVAAAAALVMSKGITDPAEVRQVLERSATPRSPKKQYGAGVLNAAAAVGLGATEHEEDRRLLAAIALAAVAGLLLSVLRAGGGTGRALGFGLALGLGLPELVERWLGFSSPWQLLFHSALLGVLLVSETEGRGPRRFAAGATAGLALHLAWDAWRGSAPFWGVAAAEAVPWLWVNAAVALGAAVVAWRLSCRPTAPS
jgi:serine protease